MQSQSDKSYDDLDLKNQPRIREIISIKEDIIYSSEIIKYSTDNRQQERIFLVTNTHIYVVQRTEGVFRSLVKIFVDADTKFCLKRKSRLIELEGITMSQDKHNSKKMLLHIRNQHDYHIKILGGKLQLAKALALEYKKLTLKDIPFYFKQESLFPNYCTLKTHLKQKKSLKPVGNQIYLDENYFKEETFKQDCFLQFAEKNEPVKLKDFQKVELKDIKNGKSYFILKEKDISYLKYMNMLVKQQKKMLFPSYIFSKDNLLLYFNKFMFGSNLMTFIANKQVNEVDLIFYVSQLIIFIEQMSQKNHLYCNFTLDNIYVNENGYLRMNSLQKNIKFQVEDEELFYDVGGNCIYYPPEVVACEGYGKGIDVWKLGVISYFMVKKKFPFNGCNLKRLYHSIMNDHYQEQQLPNFIMEMLIKDKNKRITIEQLKNSSEFKDVEWQQLEAQNIEARLKPSISEWNGKLPKIYCHQKTNN